MRIAFLVLLPLIGCAGSIEDLGTGGESPGVDAGLEEPLPPPPAFACRTKKVNNLPNGEHNPGQDCNGACHDHGFTLGGTLFSSTGATAPVTGATVTMIDATNKEIDVTTASNGNFYTSQNVTFPVRVIASACPDVAPMVTQVTQADAGCNRAGCHGVVGGGTGPVHLP